MKKLPVVLSFLFILFSCSDDSPVTKRDDIGSVEHAQKWFEQNINTLPETSLRIHSQLKNVSWEEGISYTMDQTLTVEVPIQFETELIAHPESTAGNPSYKNATKLLLFDDGKGGYNIFIMRIIPDTESILELETTTYHQKTNSFTGNIFYYSWEGIPLVYTRYENGKRKEWSYIEQVTGTDTTGEARTNGCYTVEVEWYSIACTTSGCGDPVYLYSDYYNYCDESGPGSNPNDSADPGDLYGGGGGGSGGDQNTPNEDDGIDCASFHFIATNSTWQEAAMINIGFKIKYINPQTNTFITRQLTITRPIWFGLPITTYNNTTISSGRAAEIAASAVQFASDLTHLLYIENPNTPIALAESTFMTYLQSKILMDGGRADFYGSGSSLVVPQSPSYALFGNGDCD